MAGVIRENWKIFFFLCVNLVLRGTESVAPASLVSSQLNPLAGEQPGFGQAVVAKSKIIREVKLS